MFEVNLFGQIAVTQALLPALIRSKGRVVNISSVGGKVAMATYGPYAGTKFALEAVSDSLRRELAPSGVQVVVVEPGAVRTEMLGRAIATADELVSAMTPEQSQRYGALVQAVNAQAVSSTKSGLPADAAAKVIAKAVTARKPRTRYTVGRDAALITRLARILPDRALDRVLAAGSAPPLSQGRHLSAQSMVRQSERPAPAGRRSPSTTRTTNASSTARPQPATRSNATAEKCLPAGRCRHRCATAPGFRRAGERRETG